MISFGIEDETPPRRTLLACARRACQRGPTLLPRLALFLFLTSGAAAETAPLARPSPTIPPDWRVLFLRVDFPDVPAKRPWSDFRNPARTGLIDRLVSFYDEVSRRRFHIRPMVTERVYRLPRRKAFYVHKPGQLIEDALALASAPEPKGESVLLGQAAPDAVVVFFAGPGAESDIERKMPGRLPWSNALTGGSLGSAAGYPVGRGIVVAEDPFPPLSPFGVMAHEFGHILGLPELYAPNKLHEGIGIWGLMGQGTWVGLGESPPHLSAWCKHALGWVDAIVVDETQTVSLPSVQKSGRVVKVFAKGPEHPHEYFLIENRTKEGFDGRIPGAGLLIWHVDESVTSFRRSQDNPVHKRLDLLTADSWPSHLDLGHTRGGNRGDAGDPWSGRRHGPGPRTKPSTAAYDGTPGRFSIENISPAGEVMTFDVVFEAKTKASDGAR
jgi:M6 family metalloprotease-like protein